MKPANTVVSSNSSLESSARHAQLVEIGRIGGSIRGSIRMGYPLLREGVAGLQVPAAASRLFPLSA